MGYSLLISTGSTEPDLSWCNCQLGGWFGQIVLRSLYSTWLRKLVNLSEAKRSRNVLIKTTLSNIDDFI